MRDGNCGMRGWPLLSLAILLGGWIIVRAAIWDTPFSPGTPTVAGLSKSNGPAATLPSTHIVSVPEQAGETSPSPLVQPYVYEPLERPVSELPLMQERAARTGAGRAGLRAANRIVAHTMLLAAAYRGNGDNLRAPQSRPSIRPIAPGVVYAPEAAREFERGASISQWSLDIWALWRDDTTTPLTSGRPSYGRSQAGAILAYRLGPASALAPQLHLRATRALEGARETDLAIGASARPIPAIPVRIAAEARVSETGRGTRLRGAAYAVTEIAPMALPAGLTGEAYLQGGYVTGEFATPFADGQARVTRELAGAQNFRLTAGGAAWGGAQNDAQRLDIGPTAGLSFRIGQARGRIAADYRFRIAGDAQPSSGPALTLVTGF
ncbi:MAG: hypothetical protein WA957_08340 [Alteraurantiacibacter sp.]